LLSCSSLGKVSQQKTAEKRHPNWSNSL